VHSSAAERGGEILPQKLTITLDENKGATPVRLFCGLDARSRASGITSHDQVGCCTNKRAREDSSFCAALSQEFKEQPEQPERFETLESGLLELTFASDKTLPCFGWE
jgi:hypothetical protein